MTTALTLPAPKRPTLMWVGRLLTPLLPMLLAVFIAFALFSLLLIWLDRSPLEFLELVWTGGFGSGFSLRNTLQRVSPLVLCALAVAIRLNWVWR